jgi:hypothetical protein
MDDVFISEVRIFIYENERWKTRLKIKEKTA